MSSFESDDDDDDDQMTRALALSLVPNSFDPKDFVKIQVKWKTGKEYLFDLNAEATTVAMLRELLERSSGVLKRNQKLIGLSKPGKPLDDNATIASLGCKVAAGVIKISMVGSTLSEIDSVSSGNYFFLTLPTKQQQIK